MPGFWVKLAGGKDVERGTGGDGYIGDDEPVMVLGHILVDGIGEKLKVSVKEEDYEESEDGCGGELGDGAHYSSRHDVSRGRRGVGVWSLEFGVWSLGFGVDQGYSGIAG